MNFRQLMIIDLSSHSLKKIYIKFYKTVEVVDCEVSA